jgi:hypothetical protein
MQALEFEAGAFGLMALVDVPGVGLGFVEVTEQAEAEIAAQRGSMPTPCRPGAKG